MRRIDAFDGLRSIACGLVMLLHFAPLRIHTGFLGVNIFFVLSGYLITSILVREFAETGDISFRRFYFQRFARLTPALAVLIVAAIAALVLIPNVPYTPADIAFAGTYTMDFAMAADITAGGKLGHTWSLAIEEQFYLLWPIVLLFLLRWNRAATPFVALGLGLASEGLWTLLQLHGSSAARIYYGFDTRAGDILIGCAAAFLPAHVGLARMLSRFWWPPWIILTGIMVMNRGWDASFFPLGGCLLIAVASAWIIVALRAGAAPTAILRHPVLVYTGKISYGLYLWHYFIIGISRALHVGGWMEVVICVPATFVIAALSHRYIEAPLLQAARERTVRRLALV